MYVTLLCTERQYRPIQITDNQHKDHSSGPADYPEKESAPIG